MNRRSFEQLTETVFEALPKALLEHVDNVIFVIEDWPDDETMAAMALASRFDLLGLYRGLPLAERSIDMSGTLPDEILLYQGPIEFWAKEDHVSVYDVIYDTLLHEIGHHFGFDEEQLAALEQDASAANGPYRG